ncbi:hypothetical protein BDZ89DRAFT_1133401 [Hymenopellis radicata]|nr:hypothetical protein BDZ89DRAFT_1133401 [Hymenopellis radicata]
MVAHGQLEDITWRFMCAGAIDIGNRGCKWWPTVIHGYSLFAANGARPSSTTKAPYRRWPKAYLLR